ncbi:hypothetical protein EBU91_02810 [bacterium]|nr:hypothetical protein [bacterium]
MLGKKVVLSDKYHSKIPVSADSFKLEPDYSGGSKMNELITGPMPYGEAIPVLIKVLKWIEANGWTTDRCAFQFSISFDPHDRKLEKMERLDRMKFILGIDEGIVYSSFGNRTNNVYAKSLKKIVPVNKFSILENITTIDPKLFKLPGEKYYGANFTKLQDGYVEIRYLGGKDYQKKINPILEVTDYVTLLLHDILSGKKVYEKEDVQKLQEMMRQHTKVVRSFSNPDSFFMNYPDFHVLVDLKGYEENIKTYWSHIREKIFDLIVEGGIQACFFNYDTSIGRFQIKDAKSKNGLILKDVDIFDSVVKNGKLENCNLYGTQVKNSELYDCKLVFGNKLFDSKFQNSIADYGNLLENCYIDCPQQMVDCEVKGGVLRKADLGRNSLISEQTEKVKDFNEIRTTRFIADSRLKNLNDPIAKIKFKNINY